MHSYYRVLHQKSVYQHQYKQDNKQKISDWAIHRFSFYITAKCVGLLALCRDNTCFDINSKVVLINDIIFLCIEIMKSVVLVPINVRI